MVDPMLPNLGQQPSTRSFVTSTERIRVIHECGATICRNDMYVIFGSLAPVWHADENIWVVQRPALTPRSGCVRILGQHMPLNRVRMAELFCGHMGGWRSATRSMQEWKVQVALDNDEHAVATYNLNYGGRIVRQPEGITTEMAQSELLLCCGVEDFRWLNAFNHKEVECLSVSSPCQSWSLMGSGSGTASPNGEALVTTVQICRLVQPVLILFEQVQGFRQHSEFELFQKTMLEAGFKIAASGVHNLELLSPTTRRRWLAVFINTAHVRRWDILGCFLRPLVRETHNFDPARHCLPMLSDGQLSALHISVDEMKILDDPDLLPRWLKRPFQAASAIHMRIQRGGAPLPTINAAYRKAVCFHKEALGGKGLMSWVIQDAHGDVRWFSKFEALMVMGFPADFILPKDEPHAFQAIGNAISPLQAALVMTFATDVLSVQQGGSQRTNFGETLAAIRSGQADIQQLCIRQHGEYHERLESRGPQPGRTVQCPHCGLMTALPLVQACSSCALIACQACVTDKCNASHFPTAPAQMQEELEVDAALQAEQKRSGYDELSASLLSVSEMARGYILESSDVDLRSTGQIDLRNGVVISMAPPWRNRDRMPHPYAPPPSPTTTDQIPVRRGRRGEVREQVTALSGYVDVNGCFRVLCPPTAGQTWRQWLEREVMPPPAEVWATMDGRHLHDQHCLSGEPVLIRLHFRARGGAKPDAMAKKLAAHLQEKGVPEDVSAERAQHIITAIGMPAVVEAYQTLDPWKSLKVAAGTRVRMVLQHELKSHREAGKVRKGDERPPDPWLISDPWKQSKQQQPQPQAQPLVISLVPGCFIDGMQEPVPILQHICTDANGVAIADFDEVEALAQSESFLSADELAAVVIGTTKPRTGTFACKDITFPAFHGKDKILLRGFMVTFGSRPVFLQQPKHSINIDVEEIAVVAMEMRKEFIADWPGAVKNPLKYTWSMIDGLQKATVTTWSRKFFAGRKESKPDEATSWHAFLKLPAAQLESFLTMSGRGGIFLTPKDAASSAPMGRFRVIWLDTLELEKAMKVHRMHPELLGLVRGRTSLGVRTHASDYSMLRRRLDPSWSSEGLSTDLVVARKWVIAPLPTQTDKKLLQEIINRLSWKAVPLKQISANSWLVGSGEDDCPPSDTFELGGKTSLISEQHGKRSEPVEEAIIAAPTAFKRTFQHHLAKKQPVQSVVPESLQDATLSVTQAPGPSKAMRDEFSGRLADLQEQLQSAINTVNERVTSAVATMSDRVTSVESQAATMSTEVQATVLGQSQRIQQLETSMQTISGSMVTKADLAEALKMAMESQANDIRLMLNPKRSPEVSPSHGAKASRTA